MEVEGRSYAAGLMPVRMGMANLAGDVDAGSCIRETFLHPSEVDLHVVRARFARSLRYAYVAGVEEEVARHLEPLEPGSTWSTTRSFSVLTSLASTRS